MPPPGVVKHEEVGDHGDHADRDGDQGDDTGPSRRRRRHLLPPRVEEEVGVELGWDGGTEEEEWGWGGMMTWCAAGLF